MLSSIVSVGIGFTDWGAKGSIGAMAVLLLAPVVAGTAVMAQAHRTSGAARVIV